MTVAQMFQRATVTRIITETPDARTFVLTPHDAPFPYRAGQYCTLRVQVGDEELYRSYSMSSAPETDTELMTTVKRVPGGRVSNWLLDNVTEGDELTMTRATGTFCLDDTDAPLLGFAGGSGITPILSLAKSALAGTARPVRLLCADRDATSAIFDDALTELAARHPGRLTVQRHRDCEHGLLDAATVTAFVGADTDADCYLCGPEGFMAVVRSAWTGPGRLFAEDFDPAAPADAPPAETDEAVDLSGTVTIRLGKKTASVPRVARETLLGSARRAGLAPPFSCEAGNCGTCIAHITEGSATMIANTVLDDDEIADGYILTCQAVPDSASITVDYE